MLFIHLCKYPLPPCVGRNRRMDPKYHVCLWKNLHTCLYWLDSSTGTGKLPQRCSVCLCEGQRSKVERLLTCISSWSVTRDWDVIWPGPNTCKKHSSCFCGKAESCQCSVYLDRCSRNGTEQSYFSELSPVRCSLLLNLMSAEAP